MDYVRLTCLFALLPLLPASAKDNALKIYPLPVNTAADEDEPFVADNGLTLYFCATTRTGKEDFMIATRRAAGGVWGKPQLLDAWIVTKEGNDRGVFTAGGTYPQYIFYATTKDKKTNNYDLYVASKDDRGKSWSAERPVANVNTKEDELHPCVSFSGRTLFFSRKTKDGWKQMMSSRTETKGPGGWQEPKEVGLPVGFHHAAITADGKTMYLQGPAGKDRWGLFVSRAEGKGWSTPEELAGLNAESGKVGTRSPSLSRDGRFLYFASDRDGGKGGMDLYYIPVADLTRKSDGMKVKQSPEDFVVEELTDVTPGERGDFALYRLDKIGWATPDALAAIRRRWDIDLRRLSYGGLKDRHARTTQFITIHHGPRRNLTHHGVTLSYLGTVSRPYTSGDIRANRFAVTLRDLAPADRPEIDARFAALSALGVPNYFDDQRFGFVSGPGGEFIGRLLVKREFEEALKLALAGPYAHDDAAAKAEKQTLRDHWGDWAVCKDRLPRSHARSLVDYLRVHPGDFKGAVVRLRPELRGLYLSAYQSHLWNRMLARWIETHATACRMVEQRLGPVPFPLAMGEAEAREYAGLELPLPSARWKPPADDPRLPLTEAVLAEEGLTLRDVQVRGVRELFFSRGERAARIEVMNATAEWADDERHAGRLRLTLCFELGRGSYATLVVKGVT